MKNEYVNMSTIALGNNAGRARFGDFWDLLLFPFIVGLMTLSYVAGLSKVVVLFGLLLTGAFLVYFLYHRMTLLPEVIIYFVWIFWSLSGYVVAVDRALYLKTLLTAVQTGFLLFLISGIISLKRNVSVVMLAIILGGLVVLLSSFYTGEFLEAGEAVARKRASGLVGNANGFAYTLMFIVYAIFYFWNTKRSAVWRIGMVSVLALTALGIVYSGSRTGIAGLMVFLTFWWLFCVRKELPRHPIKIYVIVAAALFGLYLFLDHLLFSTFLWQRIQHFQDNSSLTRYELYEEGAKMIRDHPIFGVGLNNFSVLSPIGLYSHSNYVEIASTTGIIGFVLFFALYFMVWRRLGRIRKIYKEPQSMYTAGLFRAAILTMLIQSFSTVNYYSKITWVFMAAVIGYTWSMENLLIRVVRLHRGATIGTKGGYHEV